MKPLIVCLWMAWAGGAVCVAQERFQIEAMPNPVGVDPQVGGMDVLPDGRVVVAFHRGEVMIFEPQSRSWSAFAEGLQEPLGLIAESASSLLVMQRAELTRIQDTDGDGRADRYDTVFDEFGMTGNYHEFAFGPAKGPDGSLFIGLNVASNGAGIRPEIRGEWSTIGKLDRNQMVDGPGWKRQAAQAGRMYSRVPWRGWILRISPDGSMEPYASGLRSPDGLGFDAQGNLLVTDNQGDWRGTSPLYVVRRGGFYGHPASLAWSQDWDRGDPLALPVEELNRMRTPESARFPHGDLADSPTQPVVFPDSWGPYAGQVLIGEMNQKRLVRYLSDEVGGLVQGALLPMMDGTSLGNGNHRLAFAPDGSLWVGKTHLSWAGAEGLIKVTPVHPERQFLVTSVTLESSPGSPQKQWFRIAFSQPVQVPAQPPGVKRYDYHYHAEYGSPKIHQADVPVSALEVSPEGRELRLELEATPGFVHRIDLSQLQSAQGAGLEGKVLYYQVSKLP